MTFPADTFEEAVDLSITASNQLHTILNGDSTTEVAVEDGSKIPSVRKAMVDSLYFKPPIAWAQGEYEDTYNQLREFVDGDVRTWWFAKGATVSTPVLMTTNPATDPNWTLWSAVTLNAATYETQKRLAAEAGLNMVGSFLLGATVTTTIDVVFYESDGKYYSWSGSFPKVVSAGSTPASTGGVGAGAWVDRTQDTLRNELMSVEGDSLVGYATYAQIRSYTGDLKSIRCGGRDAIYSGDGAHGKFYQDDSDVTSADNDGTVLIDTLGRRWKRRFKGEIYSHWFGLNKNTTGDASTKLQNFFNSISNTPKAIMSDGTFNATKKINSAATNTHVLGVQGATKISGAFGYTLFDVLSSSNTIYEGIIFENLYANLIGVDEYYSTVHSRNQNLSNIKFLRCGITCPNCIGNGISIYLNGLTTDAFSCDGFDIEECDFYDIGRQACTLMNRNSASSKYNLFKNVKFNRNKIRRIGIHDANYGMGVSFDGFGSGFQCDFNDIVDCKDIGIECTGWGNGSISHNTFSCGSLNSIYKPFGVAGGFNVDVVGNKCLTGLRGRAYFSIGAKDCNLRDNFLWTKSDANQAQTLTIADTTGLRGGNNVYIQESTIGRYCVEFNYSGSSICTNNKLVGDKYFLKTATGFDCVRFTGGSCYNNVIEQGYFERQVGGYASNVNGASKNLLVGGDTPDALNRLLYNYVVIGDANITLNVEAYSAEHLLVAGTLTASRTLTFPADIVMKTLVSNLTAFPIVLTCGGGVTVTLAAGKRIHILRNGTNVERVSAEL